MGAKNCVQSTYASVFSEYRTWIVLLKVMQFFHPGNHQNPTTDDTDKWLKELELLYGRGIRELVTERAFQFWSKGIVLPRQQIASLIASQEKRKHLNKSSNNNGTAPHQYKRLKKKVGINYHKLTLLPTLILLLLHHDGMIWYICNII